MVPAAILAIVTSLWSHEAEAQGKKNIRQAKNYFAKAETDYRLSRFNDALKNYQKAYELYPAPDFLFNIGQCYRNLKQYERAIFSFEAYLRDSESEESKARVLKLISVLKKEQARDTLSVGRKSRENSKLIPSDQASTPPSVYSRWWFWTSVVVVAGAVGGGIYLTTQTEPTPQLGTLGGEEWR